MPAVATGSRTFPEVQPAVTSGDYPRGRQAPHWSLSVILGFDVTRVAACSLKRDELVNLHVVITGAAIVLSGHDELDRVLARAQLLREQHVGVECVVVG
jgi:hypothetical protein